MQSPSEHRLPFEAPIYEMEARLAEMEAQYAKNKTVGRRRGVRRTDPPPPPRARRAEADDLRQPRSLPDRPGLATPPPPPDPRLHRADLRPVHRAARRPRHRRRQGRRHRAGPPGRPEGDVRRPPEGQEPGRADRLQLRLRPPRGLPQGARTRCAPAAKFGLPIISFIDTPGAYPGIAAEERGQAAIIAENLMAMSQIDTPIVCVVIGEGGSGGALGIGIGDKVAMLEHAYYSVISPEGCATILWKSNEHWPKAAAGAEDDQPRPAPLRRRRRGHPRARSAAPTATTARPPRSSSPS